MPKSVSSRSDSSESDSSESDRSSRERTPEHDRQEDIRRVAKILRDGNYSYDQSAHLIKKARRRVGLSPPDRSSSGSPERLSSEEQEAFLSAAYDRDGRTGLQMRVLLETGARVSAFVQVRVEDISFRDLEIRLRHTKGDRPRDVPILSSLANELKLHVGDRVAVSVPAGRALLEAAHTADRQVRRRGGGDPEAGLPAPPAPHRRPAARGRGDAGGASPAVSRARGAGDDPALLRAEANPCQRGLRGGNERVGNKMGGDEPVKPAGRRETRLAGPTSQRQRVYLRRRRS
jgi:integrase